VPSTRASDDELEASLLLRLELTSSLTVRHCPPSVLGTLVHTRQNSATNRAPHCGIWCREHGAPGRVQHATLSSCSRFSQLTPVFSRLLRILKRIAAAELGRDGVAVSVPIPKYECARHLTTDYRPQELRYLSVSGIAPHCPSRKWPIWSVSVIPNHRACSRGGEDQGSVPIGIRRFGWRQSPRILLCVLVISAGLARQRHALRPARHSTTRRLRGRWQRCTRASTTGHRLVGSADGAEMMCCRAAFAVACALES
jgi:hypothetical protein